MKRIGFLLTLLLTPFTLQAALDTDIKISLGEPAGASVYSGVANLRGWSFDGKGLGIDRIELEIDGVVVADIPHGGLRGDVGGAFPLSQEANHSGFSMAFNYNALTPGGHKAKVTAYNSNGDHNFRTANFRVAQLSSGFISDSNKVDISSGGQVELLDPLKLKLSGAIIDGKSMDIQLEWRTATQGFAIREAVASIGPVSYLSAANGFWQPDNAALNFLFQIYIKGGNQPRAAAATFMNLNDDIFQTATGYAEKNAFTFQIDDNQLTAQYKITFTSPTKADALVISCLAKVSGGCSLQSGDTVPMNKRF